MTRRAGVVACLFGLVMTLKALLVPVSAAPAMLHELPMALLPWIGTEAPPLSAADAQILAADTYLHRFYMKDGTTVEMDVAYYLQPRVGANMHSPLNCLPGTGWQIVETHATDIRADYGSWRARELLVTRGPSKYALTYWYQNRDRVLSSEVTTRLYLLSDAVRRRAGDSSLVRVMMPVGNDGVAARTMLREFAARLIPELAARW